MIWADVILGARSWLAGAVALASVAAAVLAWTYSRTQAAAWIRVTCGLLKAAAVVLLVLCLVEPLYTGTRPRPGSNLFLVLADNSRSLHLADRGGGPTRAQRFQAVLKDDSEWLTRLGQDFDVRRYAFDTALRPVQEFSQLTFDGEASAMGGSLESLAQRFRGQPIAGILLLTDGNATDLIDRQVNWSDLPPIYPVTLGAEPNLVDVAVAHVAVSQTNFEASPVTIVSEIETQGVDSRQVIVRILDEKGAEVARQTASADGQQRRAQRFLIKPERPGVSFYEVQASVEGEEQLRDGDPRSIEATSANNRRIATVDRGGGPYRVLYVSGAPNWEFKFLRRALQADDEVHLVGLVRIARKEPKFAFLGRSGERTNPLFRGFGNQADQEAEQYNEPVLLRLSTEDKDELRGGFPKEVADLYRYHAVILDDIEAAFFNQDQLSLLQQFVNQRGGGLLMLGGRLSFQEGGYARTPVSEMLPVYLDRATAPPTASEGFRLRLTREGWLQPWLRVQANEQEENRRLTEMPAFRSLNRIDSIKPGASVLADVESSEGDVRPALVAQSFGRGRVAALLVGDLWRWHLRRPDATKSDLEKSWRQTVRWLVADVPQAVEVETKRTDGPGLVPLDIVVRARDKLFVPLDNAQVKVTIQTPDDRRIEIVAESGDDAAGTYHARFAPRVAGAYRAQVSVTAADGSPVGQRETGWAVEPQTDEFRLLTKNQALLERIAQESGGETIPIDQLSRFIGSLPNRKIPIVENWSYPLWHQWSVLVAALGCLVSEWGIRRWKGLP